MSNLNILIINNLSERHLDAIARVAPDCKVQTISDLKEADEYITNTDILVPWGHMDISELYAKPHNIKWIHTLSAGVEGLLIPKLQGDNTLLTNSRGIHGIPISEHVLGMLLAFTRGLNTAIHNKNNKIWKRYPVSEIHDKTIGIVGLGSIGREIAKKAKGMGMNVVASKRTLTTELFVDVMYTPDKLLEMLAICDFVVVSLPLLPETKELFNLTAFKAMKPSAYFINIARGGVVNQADLLTALETNIIKGAGLDVFEHEPLEATNPLWDMPNVIITPHLAALSPNYLDRAIKLFADNLSRFLQHKEMLNVIDKLKGY